MKAYEDVWLLSNEIIKVLYPALQELKQAAASFNPKIPLQEIPYHRTNQIYVDQLKPSVKN